MNFPLKKAPDLACHTNPQDTVRTFREQETGSPRGGCGPSQMILSAFVILRNQQPDKGQQEKGPSWEADTQL